jgi:2-methylcitrate dehydratase PrpD
MGLDAEPLHVRLSIAGSQSAGLRENFGTMTKPFHAGRSSGSGVAAAQFAGYGWTADGPDPGGAARLLQRGGRRLRPERRSPAARASPGPSPSPGVSIKPHPSGSLTHPGMTEMERLIREHRIEAKDVVRVRVGTNHNMPNALIHHRPRNELQAKFSMEFCMAILLLDGRAGPQRVHRCGGAAARRAGDDREGSTSWWTRTPRRRGTTR